MKKITLIIATLACVFCLQGQTTINVTQINGMTVDDYHASLSSGNLVEGEDLVLTIEYANVQDNGVCGVCLTARYLNDWSPDFGQVDQVVTTSSSTQTTTITVAVPNVTANIGTARIQVFGWNGAGDEFHYVTPTTGGWTISDILSTSELSPNKLNAFYSASIDAVVLNDNNLDGGFSVFNMLGKEVLAGDVSREISVSALKSGLYILATEIGSLKFAKVNR